MTLSRTDGPPQFELTEEQVIALRRKNIARLIAQRANPLKMPPLSSFKLLTVRQKDYKARPLKTPVFPPVRLTAVKPYPNSSPV